MAIVTLPTRTDISVYAFTVELDNELFAISLTFNVRSNHWYMSIADADGIPVREGIKLVSNWPLLLTWIQQGRPAGEMICASPYTDEDPDRDTLGTSSVFVYDEGGAIG